ncbi:RsmD family RNA methyltransferase [Nakamurella flava]|uniref:RsmD family RNA methyltransferase n=1 Tax=Nakamurella flava TaxID=2576308 RepID=UPI00140D9955
MLQSHWAAELAARSSPGPILELCAGAGQIGLAAAVLSGRDLVQVEADPVAAEYAWHNAAAAGHGAQVQVRSAPMQHALAAGERFPLVVADPPYLSTADIARWPEDPVTAIDGGADGLDLTRVCLRLADTHLTPAGVLLLQVAGEVQARAVVALLATPGGPALRHVETRQHDAERAVMLLARSTVSAR